MPDRIICGRLLVGAGSDTYDPVCILNPGHRGICRPLCRCCDNPAEAFATACAACADVFE